MNTCFADKPLRPLGYITIERVVGLEPTLFHIGSMVPYLLGDTRKFVPPLRLELRTYHCFPLGLSQQALPICSWRHLYIVVSVGIEPTLFL